LLKSFISIPLKNNETDLNSTLTISQLRKLVKLAETVGRESEGDWQHYRQNIANLLKSEQSMELISRIQKDLKKPTGPDSTYSLADIQLYLGAAMENAREEHIIEDIIRYADTADNYAHITPQDSQRELLKNFVAIPLKNNETDLNSTLTISQFEKARQASRDSRSRV